MSPPSPLCSWSCVCLKLLQMSCLWCKILYGARKCPCIHFLTESSCSFPNSIFLPFLNQFPSSFLTQLSIPFLSFITQPSIYLNFSTIHFSSNSIFLSFLTWPSFLSFSTFNFSPNSTILSFPNSTLYFFHFSNFQPSISLLIQSFFRFRNSTLYSFHFSHFNISHNSIILSFPNSTFHPFIPMQTRPLIPSSLTIFILLPSCLRLSCITSHRLSYFSIVTDFTQDFHCVYADSSSVSKADLRFNKERQEVAGGSLFVRLKCKVVNRYFLYNVFNLDRLQREGGKWK